MLTLFPDMFEAVLNESIIGRAQKNGLVNLQLHNIRDFSDDKHKQVDDYPYGGGLGMVMQCQPIFTAVESIKNEIGSKPHTLLMSPQGKTFNQSLSKTYATYDNLIIICGHYEGVDERIIENLVDEEVSLGDFIITGGEIAAIAVIDSISRLIPGVLKHEDAHTIETFSRNLLEYPQYTRPSEFRGLKVPDILLSGHHEKIKKWRMYQSIKRTVIKRFDLLDKALLNDDELDMLSLIIKELEENNEL